MCAMGTSWRTIVGTFKGPDLSAGRPLVSVSRTRGIRYSTLSTIIEERCRRMITNSEFNLHIDHSAALGAGGCRCVLIIVAQQA